TFFVVLTNPVNATIDKGRAVGVIINDDGAVQPVLQFSDPRYRVDESGVKADVTVIRTGGSKGKVSVNYTVRNGAALANLDYTPVFGTIVFEDGDMTPKDFVIPIIDDNLVEGDESFVVVLFRPTGGARIGDRNTAFISINDNDTSPNPVLIAQRAVNFGTTVNDAATRAVRISNPGGAPLNYTLALSMGAGAGFSIDPQATSGT